MKKLHVAKQAVEAHLIKGFLEANGVDAEVRGAMLTSGLGELPGDVCTVWVLEDGQYERANQLVIAFLNGSLAIEHRHRNWACAGCGEPQEGQFTSCWNCGAERPRAAAE